MTGFVLHPEAYTDIEDIWEFIAEDTLDAADRVREHIYEAIGKLISFPHQGHRRTDLTLRPIRFVAVRSYLSLQVFVEIVIRRYVRGWVRLHEKGDKRRRTTKSYDVQRTTYHVGVADTHVVRRTWYVVRVRIATINSNGRQSFRGPAAV